MGGTRETIAELIGRDAVTVVVTDSGLGGLSVAGGIERRAREAGVYRSLRVVFANALPEARRGYNTMATDEEKARVFGGALAGMVRAFRPDLVLVACNTLSVLLPRVVRASDVPLLGIVGMGVEMLEERLRAVPGSVAIVFGTETTAAAGTHRAMLLERGIEAERVITQACPLLAREIEDDASSAAVVSMVDRFAGEAVERITRPLEVVIAGLCCTHYGYVADRFAGALRRAGATAVETVDPNQRMAEALFPPGRTPATRAAQVSVRVVSRAGISDAEVRSIATLVEPVSAPTAAALRGWEQMRDLFTYPLL
ncbi:MAG: aspartate/glutamate racemase family protein [Acidobacteriota bacterium]